jgi:two-component SAPR family response regulator
MPTIDGVEAAKQLKIINPNLKIILLTADAYLQGNQLECVDKLLMKPVQSAEIDSAIRELLL